MKMGDEYKCNNNNNGEQQLYHHRYSFHQRTTAFLLPMLCRLSIKDDVKVKQCKDRSPASPKVSCIGQVKRRNSSKIPFPTPHNYYFISSSSSSSKKRTKLKRFFSGKNLNTAATATTGDGKSRKVKKSDDDGVNVSELDPPLPVVVMKKSGEVSNLWNRRRRSAGGEASLKTLQIHYLPNNNQIIPPTPTPTTV